MFLRRVEAVEKHLRSFVGQHYGVQLSRFVVERPPRTELGDLAFPFPFELAKTLRRPPRQIAQEIVANFVCPPGVARLEAAGAGYVNVFLDRRTFVKDLYEWVKGPFPSPQGPKVIVEHTNINPNKAAHIGHLRNAALGDTFVRLLRASGQPVEVQNYIDNTGVQVADVVVGFQQLRRMTTEEVKQVPDPFDYYCWDLYAEVSAWFADDESRQQYRLRALKEIEEGYDETARMADYVSDRIVRAHLDTMLRLGVRYDVLPRESEILRLHFWDEAFRKLRDRQAVAFCEEGPNKGCWVMQLPGNEDGPEDEKIIVRSNGTVTYVGKDIAYQLWKFGLLGKTFQYRPFCRYPDGAAVWVSTAEPGPSPQPDFGGGRRVYNVIDVRQSYLQRVVVEGLRALGYVEQAQRSTHFSYEMVALSPVCCTELGIRLSDEDKQRPYVEVSGRKGLGVKADDLIDKLVEKSVAEVRARQADLAPERQEAIARQIAVGALRYFLLKYSRTSVIAFDFAEALSFEGETGPYLQYSVVRANNIFRKFESREAADVSWTDELTRCLADPTVLSDLLEEDEIWGLLLTIARLDDMIAQAVATLEISGLAKHAFTLAQQFNLFYHRRRILSETDPVRKCYYLLVADIARLGLLKGLELLGIEVPEKM
jgi:arginyl-tRNA synthetase